MENTLQYIFYWLCKVTIELSHQIFSLGEEAEHEREVEDQDQDDQESDAGWSYYVRKLET